MAEPEDDKDKSRKTSPIEFLVPLSVFVSSFIAILTVPFGSGRSQSKSLSEIISSVSQEWPLLIIAAFLATYAAAVALILLSEKGRRILFEAVRGTNILIGSALTSIIGLEVSLPKNNTNSIDELNLNEILKKIKEESKLPSNIVSKEFENNLLHLMDEALKQGFDDKINNALTSVMDRKSIDLSRTLSIDILKASSIRLRKASSTVTVRGFLNLIIGISFAFTALYFLKQAIDVIKPSEFRSLDAAQISYLVGIRLSLTIVITAISYFFFHCIAKVPKKQNITKMKSHLYPVK